MPAAVAEMCECGRGPVERRTRLPADLAGCAACNKMDGHGVAERDVIALLRIREPLTTAEIAKTRGGLYNTTHKLLLRMLRRGLVAHRLQLCEVDYTGKDFATGGGGNPEVGIWYLARQEGGALSRTRIRSAAASWPNAAEEAGCATPDIERSPASATASESPAPFSHPGRVPHPRGPGGSSLTSFALSGRGPTPFAPGRTCASPPPRERAGRLGASLSARSIS